MSNQVSKIKVVIILPSGGKTTLTSKQPHRYVDSDMLLNILGYEVSKESIESIKQSDGWDIDKIDSIVGDRTLLSNFDPNWLLGSEVYKDVTKVGYVADQYVGHVKLSGREDLLTAFGEKTLTDWANSDWDITLRKGVYIADVIADL